MTETQELPKNSYPEDGDRHFLSLFPPSTSIKDYAYPDLSPLRVGDFVIADEVLSLEEYDYYEADDYEDNDTDEINRKAIALFDFNAENDNEVRLHEGQVIWILYRHGQGWLVAEDPETGENGLVPEEYVQICYDEDEPKPFLPELLLYGDEGEWVDTDDEDDRVVALLDTIEKLEVGPGNQGGDSLTLEDGTPALENGTPALEDGTPALKEGRGKSPSEKTTI